jgi:stage IV sporulation protein FB
MSWSIRLGRFFNVPVYIHLTFILLLGFVGLNGLLRGGLGAAISGVVMITSVFACVVLHEFGHVLAARRYGIPTADVTLLPIGGVARLARMPSKPSQELVVALAGPAVNVAIAATLWPLIAISGSPFLAQLFAINIALALFNMLPAFPMDGGRVLRALLASRLDYVRATDIAASIGKGLALVLGFGGVFGLPFLGTNPMLLLIAWFVWSGAGQEAEMVRRMHGYGWPGPPSDDAPPAHTVDETGHVVHEAEVVQEPGGVSQPRVVWVVRSKR